MADSIRKRVVDALIRRLQGDEVTPLPAWLDPACINKNRSIPIGKDELPMYSIYFLNDPPTPIGNARRPVVMDRRLLIEIRVIVSGTDDDADPHCQWVTSRMASAGQLPQDDGSNLALAIMESETIFEPLEGAIEEMTVTKMRWTVEYKTLPADMTKVS